MGYFLYYLHVGQEILSFKKQIGKALDFFTLDQIISKRFGVMVCQYSFSAYHTEEEVKAEDKLWYGLQKRAWETIRKANPNWRFSHTDITTLLFEKYYHISDSSPIWSNVNSRGSPKIQEKSCFCTVLIST